MVEKIREIPALRRITFLTSPYGKVADELGEIIGEARDPQVVFEREVDRYIQGVVRGEEGFSLPEGVRWVQEETKSRPEWGPKFSKRLVEGVRLEQVFDKLGYNEKSAYLPPRVWWRRLNSAPPAAKAKALAEHVWHMNNLPDDKERREAKKALMAVMQEVGGFNPKTSPEFGIVLKRELETQGVSAKEFFK